MERQSVTSSNLSSVGYDVGQQVLEVEFNNGSVYTYSGVPEALFQDLVAASSVGKFFATRIRNSYPYKKIA